MKKLALLFALGACCAFAVEPQPKKPEKPFTPGGKWRQATCSDRVPES